MPITCVETAVCFATAAPIPLLSVVPRAPSRSPPRRLQYATLARPVVRVDTHPLASKTVDPFSPQHLHVSTMASSSVSAPSQPTAVGTTDPVDPVLIIPGFGGIAQDYQSLQQTLQSLLPVDTPIATVPLTRMHWLRTVPDRAVDHVIEEIHNAVDELLAKSRDARRVTLIAHSAAGWIARLYLGDRAYCGAGGAWHGHRIVSRLVTLGSPHTTAGRHAGSHVAFANEAYPGGFHAGVRYFCLAGDGGSVDSTQGHGLPGLDRHWVARMGYGLCNKELRTGPVVGDGVVPVSAAFLQGAEANVRLRGVCHSQRSRGPWYGHPDVVRYWSRFLM